MENPLVCDVVFMKWASHNHMPVSQEHYDIQSRQHWIIQISQLELNVPDVSSELTMFKNSLEQDSKANADKTRKLNATRLTLQVQLLGYHFALLLCQYLKSSCLDIAPV